LVTYRDESSVRVGVLIDDAVAPTSYTSMQQLIRDGARGLEAAQRAVERPERLVPERILAPIARPGKILGSGINYRSHADEGTSAWMPEKPFFFSKLPTAVIGPSDPIVLTRRDLQVDYEVELAAVIGKRAKDVSADNVGEHIFGYTLMNDVSSRAIQFTEQQPGDRQITLGKGLDSFAPIGPAIVTVDEIPDLSEIRVQSHVNGELRQDESVSKLHFSIPELIEWLSSLITLEPGDIVSSGTPGGCGAFFDPPLWLEPGDLVTVSATTVGELSNPVAAGAQYHIADPWPNPWSPPSRD